MVFGSTRHRVADSGELRLSRRESPEICGNQSCSRSLAETEKELAALEVHVLAVHTVQIRALRIATLRSGPLQINALRISTLQING